MSKILQGGSAKEINAFALPGGPIFVNRGAIEAADNEAQILYDSGYAPATTALFKAS